MDLKNISLKLEMKRKLLIELGHKSAEFLPDSIIEEWYGNYMNVLNNLDLNSELYLRLADTIADIILLDEVQYIDET